MIDSVDDIPVLLAETVKNALNQAFSGVFVAERRLLPEHEEKQLRELKVIVVPGPLVSSELVNEYNVENNWLIGIGFQKLVKRGSDTEAEAILRIIKRVRRYLNKNRIVDLGEAGGEFLAIDIGHNPYVDHSLLARGEFFSVIEITFADHEDLEDDL